MCQSPRSSVLETDTSKLVVPAGFEPATLSNLETMLGISQVFYR